MDFDDWLSQPERSRELAALVERAKREAEGDVAEVEGLLILYALQVGWKAALDQSPLPMQGDDLPRRH